MARRKGGWKRALQDELQDFLHVSYGRRDKRCVSSATIRKRSDVLFLAFGQLWKAGYKLESPYGLKPKHIEFLMQKWESEGLAASTLNNRLSIIRLFCEYLGKTGMVKDAESYVEDVKSVRRNRVAQFDKSWETAGFDALSIADGLDELEPYTAAQLRLMHAFGLRIREAVSMRPWESDVQTYLQVCRGSKGGRHRAVPIDSELKRIAIDRAKQLVANPAKNMCMPGKAVHQELNRFYSVMRKLGLTKADGGVTPHGLRHQYLQNSYSQITGHNPPIRGGVILDREKDREARMRTMLEAGHGRIDVGASYYGSARKPPARRPIDGEDSSDGI